MRVITGSARGRRLITLEGDDIVRPTAERVKEALFSIIQFDIEGRNILDLFAGSGQLGIEALSRGAERVVFVDASRKSIDVINKNLKACGFTVGVVQSDSLAYLARCGEKFDIALLDPPYASGLLEKALEPTARVMNPGGVIICESPLGTELPEQAGDFRLRRTYRHGKTVLSLYRPVDSEA